MTSHKETKGITKPTFIKTAIDVAEHFGFEPLGESFAGIDSVKVQSDAVEHVFPHERHLLHVGKKFVEHSKHLKTNHHLTYEVHMKATAQRNPVAFSLHISGTKKPLAEATLIATARAILKEAGHSETTVHMNSLGNLDASNRFNKDLVLFLKKILTGSLAASVAKEIQENPRKVYSKLLSEKHPQVHLAPNPMDYLNDEARAHLWGILEFLEGSDIPYVLDHSVMGSEDYFEHSLFQIRATDASNGEATTVAHGGRFSALTRKAFKQHVEASGIVITCDIETKYEEQKKKTTRTTKFHFAQIGDQAKKMTLKVLQNLRDAHVKVRHHFTHDTLSEQMHDAPQSEYVIVMGHKEAVDGTAIVRENKTRSQKVIPLAQLGAYLKKLEK